MTEPCECAELNRSLKKSCERIDLQEYEGVLRLLLPRLEGTIDEKTLNDIRSSPRKRHPSEASEYAAKKLQDRIIERNGRYIVTDHDALDLLKKAGLKVLPFRYVYVPEICCK